MSEWDPRVGFICWWETIFHEECSIITHCVEWGKPKNNWRGDYYINDKWTQYTPIQPTTPAVNTPNWGSPEKHTVLIHTPLTYTMNNQYKYLKAYWNHVCCTGNQRIREEWSLRIQNKTQTRNWWDCRMEKNTNLKFMDVSRLAWRHPDQ